MSTGTPADPIAGQLFSAVLVAVPLALLGAWALAWRFRRALVQAMRAPQRPAAAAAPTTLPMATRTAPAEPGLAQRQCRAQAVLVARLVAVSLLISLSLGALLQALQPDLGPASLRRWLMLGLMKAWPLVPALALLWRWSRWQLLAALALWLPLVAGVMLLNSTAQQQASVVFLGLGVEMLAPLAFVMLICMGQATRAIAPWLILPFSLLGLGSLLGLEGLAWLIRAEWPGLLWLSSGLGVGGVFVLVALAPWLLLAWPLVGLARATARAYRRQQVSDLMAVFAVLWALSVGSSVLQMAASQGLARALWLALPLLWLPLFMAATRRWAPQPPPGQAPPVLLVLRVFQRDAQVQALFDQVVERWRLAGPVVLIAGTDLVERTLDPDDLFTWLAGDLSQRFVHGPQEVARAMAAFHWAPDVDGRWRVNELYGHDQAWRDALAALVGRSDRVLMDLRGFQPHNAGCRHELQVLSAAPRPLQVVLLTDAQTDRRTLQADTTAAPPGRFTEVAAQGLSGGALRREVLGRLLAAAG